MGKKRLEFVVRRAPKCPHSRGFELVRQRRLQLGRAAGLGCWHRRAAVAGRELYTCSSSSTCNGKGRMQRRGRDVWQGG